MLTVLEKQEINRKSMDLRIVGRLFWATIPSKLTWKRAEFENAMVQAGVPAEVSPALTNRSDFIRALRSMEEGRLVRLVRENNEEIVFQTTREFNDGIGLAYEREAVITFDKTTGEVEATDQQVAIAVRSRVGNEADIYHSDDLRRVTRRLLNQQAHSLKPRSGVYFVPEMKAVWITVIRDFLEILNIRELGEFPLPDLDSIKEQMEKIYSTKAKKAISDLAKEIKKLKDEGASPAILDRRFKKINALRSKADLYRDALDIEAQEVEESLAEVENQLRRALLDVY